VTTIYRDQNGTNMPSNPNTLFLGADARMINGLEPAVFEEASAPPIPEVS